MWQVAKETEGLSEILQQKEKLGDFHRLVKELSSHEDNIFECFRMSHAGAICRTSALLVIEYLILLYLQFKSFLDHDRRVWKMPGNLAVNVIHKTYVVITNDLIGPEIISVGFRTLKKLVSERSHRYR